MNPLRSYAKGREIGLTIMTKSAREPRLKSSATMLRCPVNNLMYLLQRGTKAKVVDSKQLRSNAGIEPQVNIAQRHNMTASAVLSSQDCRAVVNQNSPSVCMTAYIQCGVD